MAGWQLLVTSSSTLCLVSPGARHACGTQTGMQLKHSHIHTEKEKEKKVSGLQCFWGPWDHRPPDRPRVSADEFPYLVLKADECLGC